jgi:hydroxypyruvate reductase
MFQAVSAADAALGVLPEGYPPPPGEGIEILFASHPWPDRRSVAAARRALAFFRRFEKPDVILCLISGGASSLLCLPRAGLTLAGKRAAIRKMMSAGASIVEINRARKRLSAIKGGQLGRATQARLVTLVLSDVPGDDPEVVGSGPTVRRRTGDITVVVGSNRSGLAAAAVEATGRGAIVRLKAQRLDGEASETGRRFAREALRVPPGGTLLAGGETTVRLSRRPGVGGRNLEFALGAARVLEGSDDVAILAAGSDGIDGSSLAAGAVVDGTSIRRARMAGLDPEAALAGHDTEPFFETLGDLVVPGPTGTNVGDWAFAVRRQV